MTPFTTFELPPKQQRDPCQICKGRLRAREDLTHHVAGRTSHVFHTTCLRNWARVNPVCPLCRTRITSINGDKLIAPPDAARRGEPEEIADFDPMAAVFDLLMDNPVMDIARTAIDPSLRLLSAGAAICAQLNFLYALFTLDAVSVADSARWVALSALLIAICIGREWGEALPVDRQRLERQFLLSGVVAFVTFFISTIFSEKGE